MKKSELFELITTILHDAEDSELSTYSTTELIIGALENEGLLRPQFLTPDGSGMYWVNYGWEPEQD